MSKSKEHNYDVGKWGNYQVISIESDRISQCMEHYRKAMLDGICIAPIYGYKLKDLAFLVDYPDVQRVIISYTNGIDLSGLYKLKNLRLLAVSFNNQSIDFSAFPKLEDLSIDWHSKMKFPSTSKAMKCLAMSNYKPKSKDFTELPDYPNLRELEIVRAPIHSLAGLGRFKKLKHLKLYYLSKLESIAALDAYSVEDLEFEVCRKIKDHAHVAKLPKLRDLRLSDCGQVESLHFLDHMPNLKGITFVNTNVLDGDMTPCFRLDYAGFLNKKHYSHTSEEVDVIIAERHKKGK